MDRHATVTSKGQITIPAEVRAALGIRPGTKVTFRVAGAAAVIENPGTGMSALVEPFPDFLALAGSVAVPAALRGARWADVRKQARAARFPEDHKR